MTSAIGTSLDDFDRAILAILQRDNHTPQRTIGAAVNLSAAAVQRRISRMEASGVIRANVAIVDPELAGRPLTIIVEVEIESERSEQIDDLKRRFIAAPEIQQCFYVTGETDFMLIVTVANMTEYEALTRRLFFADQNVKRFRTFVAMDRVKVSLNLPLFTSPG